MADVVQARLRVSAMPAQLKQVDRLVLHVALKLEGPLAIYVP